MEIAVLGWGSLIWKPGGLKITGPWSPDGPLLPVEFARISQDGRLTLVLYSGAQPVQVLWSRSACASLEEAVADLAGREGTPKKNIGYVSLFSSDFRCSAVPEALDTIREWGKAGNFDAVIWTDLPSNFERNANMAFNPDNAVTYLAALKADTFQKAKEYIMNAPEQVSTPVRRHFEDIFRWLL